jgi:hypothetical protein
LPVLQKLADELGPRGLDLVTVSLDGTAQRAARMAQRLALRAPVIVGDTALRLDFQVASYPWTLVIGRDGKAKKAFRGLHSEDKLRDAFVDALD